MLEISGADLGEAPLISSDIPPAADGAIVVSSLSYGEYAVRNLDYERGV